MSKIARIKVVKKHVETAFNVELREPSLPVGVQLEISDNFGASPVLEWQSERSAALWQLYNCPFKNEILSAPTEWALP